MRRTAAMYGSQTASSTGVVVTRVTGQSSRSHHTTPHHATHTHTRRVFVTVGAALRTVRLIHALLMTVVTLLLQGTSI